MRKQIEELVKDLRRCAKQNEQDVEDIVNPNLKRSVSAQAAEQRRVIKLLNKILREDKTQEEAKEKDAAGFNAVFNTMWDALPTVKHPEPANPKMFTGILRGKAAKSKKIS